MMCRNICKLMRKTYYPQKVRLPTLCGLKNVPPFYVFLIQIIDGNVFLAICWQPLPPGPTLASVTINEFY